MASNVLHTSSHLDSFLFSHLPLKFFFRIARHLHIQELQAFRQITDYPRNGTILFGKIPKTDTLFPKVGIPKNGKTATSFLGKRNPHFTGTPKNKPPKISPQKWFLGKSPCSGATPIILKRQFPLSSPHFSQKSIRKKIYKDSYHLNSIRICT